MVSGGAGFGQYAVLTNRAAVIRRVRVHGGARLWGWCHGRGGRRHRGRWHHGNRFRNRLGPLGGQTCFFEHGYPFASMRSPQVGRSEGCAPTAGVADKCGRWAWMRAGRLKRGTPNGRTRRRDGIAWLQLARTVPSRRSVYPGGRIGRKSWTMVARGELHAEFLSQHCRHWRGSSVTLRKNWCIVLQILCTPPGV